MRIYLHIGLPYTGTFQLQSALADRREALGRLGVRFADSPGKTNHTRLFMAVTDPDHIDPLRHYRGFGTPEAQARLQNILADDLSREVAQHTPHSLILSAGQLAVGLPRRSELERLRELLGRYSDDIRPVLYLDAPQRVLAQHYSEQILGGRITDLGRDLDLVTADDWWKACLEATPETDPDKGLFAETQGAPFWLDYRALIAHWGAVFGEDALRVRAYDARVFSGPDLAGEIAQAFDITAPFGKVAGRASAGPVSAATLTRGRQFNALVAQMLERTDKVMSPPLWRQCIAEMSVPGAPLDPAMLAPLARRFHGDNLALAQRFDVPETLFDLPEEDRPWAETDPTLGFRPSQYLLQSMWRIDRATRAAKEAAAQKPQTLSETARQIMPARAIAQFEHLSQSRFAPHNRIGTTPEDAEAPAYDPAPPRQLPEGSTGRVIVGCMKNEGPYILEWVAYHRAIGIDNFLIYTNGCEDGTDEILGRLDAMGVVTHRINDDWKGKSPQQYALNKALKEPVIQNADWIIHIDVDEFINVRCGNGTLDDFLKLVPDATNVAMTWRLFGHNGVHRLDDRFVIEQFETCAPKYCPKPHTAWGFKTMLRNIGAYAKLSCHRPNKLQEDKRGQVKWVNGSGLDMTDQVAERGWRSSMRTVGYDLLQLNHYALRSAESFLIKRQRGRALHVDRSIGLNYWIRMDWSVHRDTTIQRNLPRLRAEFDRLLADPDLMKWHHHARAWHRAKADALHQIPEFADLYKQAVSINLSATERVAYALALDMES